jgi:RNA polymerase sigma factor (sigma-70 family)
VYGRCKGIGQAVRLCDVEQDGRDFAAFYAAARDDCLRIVLVNVGDRDLAEDLVAEGFTRAWMAWRKVSQHPAPRAWVVRTALNLHVSWWRRRRREVALADHDVAAAPGQYGDQDSGIDSWLAAALRSLPLRQREVLTLRLLLDLDTETTARALGISAGTVGVHLHRALVSLRAGLGAPATGPGARSPAGSAEPSGEPPGERGPRRRMMRSGDRLRDRAPAYLPDLTGVSR